MWAADERAGGGYLMMSPKARLLADSEMREKKLMIQIQKENKSEESVKNLDGKKKE